MVDVVIISFELINDINEFSHDGRENGDTKE
mgnify:CR=1 FL=1